MWKGAAVRYEKQIFIASNCHEFKLIRAVQTCQQRTGVQVMYMKLS